MSDKKYELSEKNKVYGLSQPNGAYLLKNGKPLYHWINDDEKIIDEFNNLIRKNEQLKSLNQELKNELESDAKQYKVFLEVIDEADDLIKSHLSKHYQRKWKNFCKSKEIEV